MSNISWLQYLSYISFLVFNFGILTKVIKYVKMPLHLRWELYPIPHEKRMAPSLRKLTGGRNPGRNTTLTRLFL
jgi:predicted SPOUT superfamily RNA methylase MTH1